MTSHTMSQDTGGPRPPRSPAHRTHYTLGAAADEKMRELGFIRSYCCDLFDDDSRAHRRVMRYRALCDGNNTLTQ